MAGAMTAEQRANKQISRVQGSVQYIKDGINGVTESPTAKAAQNLDKARANYNAAIDSGKTKRALEAVPLQTWKDAAIAKADRVAPGLAAAKGKLVEFHTHQISVDQAVASKLANMPTLTLEDNIARMNENVRIRAAMPFKK